MKHYFMHCFDTKVKVWRPVGEQIVNWYANKQ
jgi:hypothetical protein